MTLAGCNWIGRQADALGSHMPVIGERCEHWQCLTSSGRATSDMYKVQNGQPQQAEEQPQVSDEERARMEQYQQQLQQQQLQYQQMQYGQQYPDYQQQLQQQPAQQQYQQYQQQPPAQQQPLTPYDYYNQ